MANTSDTYVGDGTTSTFNITFPFIDRDHVEVHLNRRLTVTTEWEFVTDSQIRMVTTLAAPNPPGVGDAVVIKRQTSISTRLVNFTAGSVLTESDLNLANKQNFYLIQEATENLTELYTNALAKIGTAEGVIDLDGDGDIFDEVIASILSQDVASDLQQRVTDIDTNAQDLLTHLGLITDSQTAAESFATAADVILQASINALAGSIASAAFVQDAEPVPGVGDVPNPIVDTSRWYDSNDDQHPYIWLPTNLTSSLYKWTAGANEDEYYVELTAGGDPGILEPQQVEEDDSYMTEATLPLSTGEWEYADGGGGFSTIIVRLSDGNDPDSKPSGFVEAYSWLDLLDPRIGVNASSITTLEATVDGPNGVVATSDALVVTDATAVTLDGTVVAVAADVVTLESTVNDGSTGVAANAAAASSLQTQVTSNDGELTTAATDITNLEATVNDGQTGVSATASAVSALDTRVTTSEGDITASASDITALESTVNDGTSGVAASASAVVSLQTQVTNNDNDLTSAATARSVLTANVATNVANISTEQTVRADADSVIAVDVALIGASNVGLTAFVLDTTTIFLDSDGGTLLSTKITQFTDADTDQAARITVEESISTRATGSQLDTDLSTAEADVVSLEAHYGVTLAVGVGDALYVTGFTLLNDGSSGTFGILADKFLIVDPANNGQNPVLVFGIDNGVVTLQNMIIEGALIVDGTIDADSLAVMSLEAMSATVGDLVIETGGSMSSGQSDYDTGTGYWFDAPAAKPRFSIGAAGGHRLTFDTDTGILQLFGQLIMDNGFIGDENGSIVAFERTQEDHNVPDYPDNWTTIRTWKMRGTGTMTVKITGQGWIGTPTKTEEFMHMRIKVNSTIQGASNGQSHGSSANTRTFNNVTWTDPDDIISIEMAGGVQDGATRIDRFVKFECFADFDYGTAYTL